MSSGPPLVTRPANAAGEDGEPVARRDFCLDEAQRDRRRRDSNAAGICSDSFLTLVFNIRQSSMFQGRTAPAGAKTILSFSERKQSIFLRVTRLIQV
jgi:hypothetical protein